MTTIQVFCSLSTIFFVLVGVMSNASNAVGLLLKAFAWITAFVGVFATASAFDFVLQNGIRLT